MNRSAFLALSIFVVMGTAVFGQSLGEVAEKEKARRKDIKSDGKVVDERALREAEGKNVSSTGSSSSSSGQTKERSFSNSSGTRSVGGREADGTGSGGGRGSSAGSNAESPAFRQCVSKYLDARGERDRKKSILENGLVAYRSTEGTNPTTGEGYTVRTEVSRGKRLSCTYLKARPNEFPSAARQCKGAKKAVAKQETLMRQIEGECMGLAVKSGLSPGDARKYFR